MSDVADAALVDDEAAVVRITASGICGSDLHIYDGHGFSPTTGYTLGHEAVGIVEEVGPAVHTVRPGDRVLVTASVACGRCSPCGHGHITLCETGESGCWGLGHALPGTQAEALAVPAADRNLVPLPEALSDAAGIVLTDNLPTAWYGARRGRCGPGDTVAVVGLGPVGLLSVLSAQVMGAARVLAIDLVPGRRAAAAALGAEPIDAEDVRAAVTEATGGRGVDVALEAVGADATVTLALDLAGREGRVSIVGVNQSMDFRMRMVLAQLKCLEIHIGLCSVQHELPTLMRLATAGRIDPSVVVTHTMDLAEGPDAYALFASRAEGVGKILLRA
ncbi:alcohol dehydrogenase catalytic domain-containing protein [Iamia sp. SCSIO 61187]|uniref:alcohol dehydrogenase catalytic domain-containing protein n=1 Tax=Iamia sp. SCSIO 61187 TaxID=2722752 RepID=UPI001C62F702|nr:alcohol dehydrogenase catalytic domain-containing protein [Iamia sp. SCSIO 61187]QYG91022.1 alcohol dehydrogenase catalytic domain-containing protein [Iamia sp. SCSIO 61187]